MYIINRYFKLYLLTPLMLSTPTLTVLNNLFTAEPLLPINVTASFIDVTAPPINDMAPSIDITAPPINITAPIKVTAAVNYGRDLATLAKIYMEKNKYSGKDNNFNRKFTIFNDLYNRVNIL